MEIIIINKTKKKIGINNLKKLVQKIFLELKFNSSICILLCGDKYCKKINEKFLNKDRPTDVLSFPLNEKNYLGDILINIRQVERQAKKYKVEFEDELKRMVIHGILHLLGFDHEKDKGKMENFENKLFLKFCL